MLISALLILLIFNNLLIKYFDNLERIQIKKQALNL